MRYFLIGIGFLLLVCCGVQKKQAVKDTPTQTEGASQANSDTTPEMEETSEATAVDQDEEGMGISSDQEKEQESSSQVPLVESSSEHKTNGLHTAWSELLTEYVSRDGAVNYQGFLDNKKGLREYLSDLSRNAPQPDWSRKDSLAYWINVYNAYTVKLVIDNYPVKSIKDIKSPWDYRFIRVGQKWYTLNDVEHRILRKMGEPRIHFAINCASVSCPKLLNKAFTSAELETQLANATHQFLSNPAHNQLGANAVSISKIFKWFARDFKQNGTLIDFLNKYSTTTIASNAKVSFKTYDWRLNDGN